MTTETGIAVLEKLDLQQLTPDARQYIPHEQVALYRGAEAKEMADGALIRIGTAVTFAGAAMWLLTGEDPPAKVTVGMVRAAAVFSGEF